LNNKKQGEEKMKLNFVGITLVVAMLIACSTKKEKQQSQDEEASGTTVAVSDAEANANTSTNVIEVVARDFVFEAPDQLVSGWNTFRFTNNGKQEHFFYIYRLPDNKTFDQFVQEAMVPFGTVWNEYASGQISRDSALVKFGTALPAWYVTEMVPSGGVGLTEAGETGETTVKLDPGLHVIECYVKMPDGSWHTEQGMQQPLTVTTDSTSAEPPEADVELTLSNYKIDRKGAYRAGNQTIAIYVAENPQGFTMHNLDLFRLEDDTTTVQQIVKWMDWLDLEQFRAPAPGYSLGGIEPMAAGRTGYVTVNFRPGNYAWVSEGYGSKGMVETFTIE